jgi:hypothetical protein
VLALDRVVLHELNATELKLGRADYYDEFRGVFDPSHVSSHRGVQAVRAALCTLIGKNWPPADGLPA